MIKSNGGYSGQDKDRDRGDPIPVPALPETRKQRTQAFLSNPLAMERICLCVANGGSLVQISKSFNIHFSEISSWIRESEMRSKAYEKALEDRKEWSKDIIHQALHEIAQTNIKDLFDEKGNAKPIHEIPDHVAKSIQSIKVTQLYEDVGSLEKVEIGEKREIKFWDKIKAIDTIKKCEEKADDKEKTMNVRLTLEKLIDKSWE